MSEGKLAKQVAVPAGIFLAMAPAVLLVFGLIKGAATSWSAFESEYVLSLIQKSFAPTLFVGLGVGGLTFLLGMFFFYMSDNRNWVKVMDQYITPSSLLIAFLFWFVPGLQSLDPILKITLAVTIATFPLVYRVFGQQHTSETNWQWCMASILGASKNLTYGRVILPGSLRTLLHLSALASVWAVGDFALSSFVSSQDLTLAMHVHQLAGNYRLNEATALIWVLLPIGGLCYIIFFDGTLR